MKFTCLKCEEKEFSIDVPEMLKDKLPINIICPRCESTNVITILNNEEIEISLKY